jgi:hypothetical protein
MSLGMFGFGYCLSCASALCQLVCPKFVVVVVVVVRIVVVFVAVWVVSNFLL